MSKLNTHPCCGCEFRHHLCKAECDILREYEKERIAKHKERTQDILRDMNVKDYYKASYKKALKAKRHSHR